MPNSARELTSNDEFNNLGNSISNSGNSDHHIAKQGPNTVISMKINGNELGNKVIALQWESFVNTGYSISFVIDDSYFLHANDIVQNSIYPKAKNEPLEVKFKLINGDTERTEERTAYITDVNTTGELNTGRTIIKACDPPTWLLSAGKGDGKAYKGNLTKVIKQVVSEYASAVNLEITETKDNKENTWWMMRMDPKTFISSLLTWSSPLTSKKTNWLISSVDKKLIIKQQHEMESNSDNYGIFVVNSKSGGSSDVRKIELLSNNFMSVLQTKIVTSGISAVTGQYIDKVINQKASTVDDLNTENKLNTLDQSDQDLSFKKSNKEWSTHIESIPEFSGGELGITYSDYIDGNARNTYLQLLPYTMRAKLVVNGDYRIHNSSKLGVSKLFISMFQFDGEKPYYLHGNWLLYGFTHKYTIKHGWFTELYIYRLDFDAKAKKVQSRQREEF